MFVVTNYELSIEELSVHVAKSQVRIYKLNAHEVYGMFANIV